MVLQASEKSCTTLTGQRNSLRNVFQI